MSVYITDLCQKTRCKEIYRTVFLTVTVHFSVLCATLSGELVEAEGEQDRLEVSSFLYSVQPDQEIGGGRGRARQTGGE